jgi:hypothetical protein
MVDIVGLDAERAGGGHNNVDGEQWYSWWGKGRK